MTLTREERERIRREEAGRPNGHARFDPEHGERPKIPDRPRCVNRAVTLLLVGTGLGAMQLVYRAQARRSLIGSGDDKYNEPLDWLFDPMFLGSAIRSAVTLFLIYKVRDGRGWARLTLLALMAPWLCIALWVHYEFLNAGYTSTLVGVAQTVLPIVALVSLFRPDASAWFRRRRAALSMRAKERHTLDRRSGVPRRPAGPRRSECVERSSGM